MTTTLDWLQPIRVDSPLRGIRTTWMEFEGRFKVTSNDGKEFEAWHFRNGFWQPLADWKHGSLKSAKEACEVGHTRTPAPDATKDRKERGDTR